MFRRALLVVASVLLVAQLAVLPAAAQTRGDLLDTVWKKLGADRPVEDLPVQFQLHVSHEPIVNAWTTPTTGDIYITQQMLGLIGSSEGELAFVLGHEIGHVVGYWTGLSTEAQKQQVETDLGSLLSILDLLFESEEDRRNRYSQIEEKLADAIGFHIIKHVGYNPYDAAAFFGRLQMYSGTTDPAIRLWSPYISGHPFKEDRIENLRRVMAQLQETQSESTEAANEASAVGSLRTLVTAAITYASTYPDAGFPSSLRDLGPQAGDLIDSELASGLKSGYRFIYSPRGSGRPGPIESFTILASPVGYGRTGQRSFFTDHSGVIRFTTEDRPATSGDPPVQDTSGIGGDAPEVGYVWIGRFSITFETADGERHEVETVDALGIYSEDDFRLAQTLEVEARKEIIRRFMLQKYAGQVVRVLDVTLKTIEKEPFQEKREPE